MQYLTVLLAFLLFLAAVNARNYAERDANIQTERDDNNDFVKSARDRASNQIRHKRRSWHSSYGYNYPQPPNPYYPDNRRDYDQQDLLPKILELLDEIAIYIKRPPTPPPPPQPLYIPYGIPYPVPQFCNCRKSNKDKPPVTTPSTIDNRFGDPNDNPIDNNQNWGLIDSNEADDEEYGDGTRPISFAPIVPKQTPKRPNTQVEHGSTQAGSVSAAFAPSSSSRKPAPTPSTPAPGMCDVFSLSCCTGNPTQQKQCFTNVGCAMTYNNGKGCDQDRILALIDAYSKAYSPVN